MHIMQTGRWLSPWFTVRSKPKSQFPPDYLWVQWHKKGNEAFPRNPPFSQFAKTFVSSILSRSDIQTSLVLLRNFKVQPKTWETPAQPSVSVLLPYHEVNMGSISFSDSFAGVKNIDTRTQDFYPPPPPPRSDTATAHMSPSGSCQPLHLCFSWVEALSNYRL